VAELCEDAAVMYAGAYLDAYRFLDDEQFVTNRH